MSKIEELIQKYCPDGVEYKRFGDIATLEKGKGLQKTDFTDEGIGCIHYGQIYTHFGISTTETLTCTSAEKAKKFTVVHHGDIVMASTSENVEDCGKSVVWLGSDDIVTGGHSIVIRTKQNPMYLAYVLQTPWFQKQKVKKVYGVKVIEFKPDELADIVIPVPPLPVQQEIVRILDSFTSLQDELQKELEERSRQYKAVTNAIFVKYAEASKKTLADISENCDSARKPITASKRVAGKTPYYGASGIVDYVSGFTHEGDYLLISEDGANLTARTMPIAFSIRGKNWVNNHAHVLKFQNYAVQKYVETYINTHDISEFITGAAQPKLNQQNLYKIEIPIPDVDDVVQASDIFQLLEALRNQIELEFSLRQQQYTYYRDKLLSFPRKEA